MSVFYDPEYKRLNLDSSNEMMEYDGDRGLGRYEKAARHIREAGFGREQMARLALAASDYRWASANSTCAADCFRQATDPARMRASLGRAQDLERQGKIPPQHRHIVRAIREREGELADLEQRLAAFDAEYTERALGDDRATLDWLIERVRDLPGLPRLHERVALHAGRVGDHDLARRHLDWAAVFAADPPPDPPAGLHPPGANGHHGATPAEPAVGPV